MKVIQNKDEQKFFQWLSKKVSPLQLNQSKSIYLQINGILIKNGLLSCSLIEINEEKKIEEILDLVKSKIANKRLRGAAVQLLRDYHKFLSEQKGIEKIESARSTIKIEKDWIKYYFTNSREFYRTKPVYCVINGNTLKGNTWAQVFIEIIELGLSERGEKLTSLYKHPLLEGKSGRAFFLENKLEGLHCLQLSNGYWVNVCYSSPRLLEMIKVFCNACDYTSDQILLYGIRKGKRVETEKREEYIPPKLVETIYEYYKNGIRFDDTVVNILEEYSNLQITDEDLATLKRSMFKRSDGLYFLDSMLGNAAQRELLENSRIMGLITEFGCIEVSKLYFEYRNLGKVPSLRNEDDFIDFLLFIMPQDIRVATALRTRVVRKVGVTVNAMLEDIASKVARFIEKNGCVTIEELLNEYRVFSEEFLRGLINKYIDSVMPIIINDCLCYQSIEAMGFDSDFSQEINSVIDQIEELALNPSKEIIHAILSLNLGYNVKDVYGIPDDKTFCRIISAYYTGEKKRIWKTGAFLEDD